MNAAARRLPVGRWMVAGEIAHYVLPDGPPCGTPCRPGVPYTVPEHLGHVTLCWGCMAELAPPPRRRKARP